MRSIRFRVIGTYLLIIVLTIFLFSVGAYTFIRDYYMNNIEEILTSGQDICQDIYNELYYQYDMELESEKIGNRFVPYTRAQVLLLDKEGNALYDSIDIYDRGQIVLERDINRVLAGETVIHKETSTLGERTLSASRTLKSNDEVIGILKLAASLEGVYRVLNRVILILAAGGLVIIVIVFMAALILSNTIIKPIRKVTDHISDIASGNLEQKYSGKYSNELSGLTDNLNILSTELESNKKLREQFIESVSHELRTPLTSIKGWIITLKNRKKTDDALLSEGLELLNSETDRLTGLVNELLDFSGSLNDAASLKPDRMDMTHLVEYTCKQMKPRADRAGITMKCFCKTEKAFVKGDYDRLKQVMINLLDNAIKYSQKGDGIAVTCRNENGFVTTVVADTGPGIPQSDLGKIFEMKYQGNNSKKGTGLGLAISKEIVELHGGDIEISSSDKGTSVTIRLKSI